MTEKRFYTDGQYVMQNKEVYVICSGEHNADVVATALNESLEENKQLKIQLQNISAQRDEFHHGARENANRVRKLKKENEQLKQAYQTLKSRHSLLHDECLEAECDRDSLKKDVISLEKENEQLKKALQEVYNDDDYLKQFMIRQLEEENNELRQDNDIKFWKLQCMHYFNSNSLFMSEISRAMRKGYKVSDKFQEYLDELEKDSKKIKEKNERLFGDSDD